MKITVIAENTALCDEIGAEHGLSLWIETAEKTILFDMGQTDLYARNAGKLGLDLRKADLAVVSHGHYDHGGGLAHFLSANDHAPVYISRHAFGEYYNANGKYIGLDAALAASPRLVFTEVTTSWSPHGMLQETSFRNWMKMVYPYMRKCIIHVSKRLLVVEHLRQWHFH